jgi:outer membrane protein TolC
MLLLGPSALAQAPSPVLTDSELARLVTENPGWAGATQARRTAAEARARAAGARPNLELDVTREGGDGLSGSGTEDSARLRYPLDLGGVRAAQRRAGLARRDAELAGLESTAAARLAQARRLLVETAQAQRRASVRQLFVERLTQLSWAVRRRVAAGDASELEFGRIEAEADAARALAARQEADAATRWGELVGLIGPTAAGFAPPSRLALGALRPLDDYMARLAQAPEARRQVAEARAAEVDAEALRRRARAPQTAVVGGLRSVDDPMGRSTGVVVGAALSLPFGGAARAEAEARAAEASALRAEQRLGDETRRATVLAAWSAAERLSRTLDAEPPRADAIIAPAEAAYEAGEIELSELLSTHRTAMDAALARIDIEQEAALARIRLDELVGMTAP